MILLAKISQSELNTIADHGALISIKKMLPNGPNLEEFAGNANWLNYGEYVMPYSTDFIAFMAGFNVSINEESTAFKYQLLIKKYIEYSTPYRGILLNQGLGSGKSRTCIMATETFRKAGIPVIFIGPASLKINFIRELMKWGNDDISKSDYVNALRKIEKGYSFISANAGNILVQLAKIGIGFPNIYDNYANAGVAKYLTKNTDIILDYPRNSVIVLEEFHNLNQKFSSTTSKIAKKVFSLLYNAKDCKFIAMSGTPIINNPFEICSMLNILSGPLIDGSPLFPLDKEIFMNTYFIKNDANEFKLFNTNELKARMMGLISFYAGAESNKMLYPDLVYEDTTYISMSPEQNVIHDHILEQEISSALGLSHYEHDDNYNAEDPIVRLKQLLELAKLNEDKYSHNSYRIFSRAACNFVWNIEADDVQKPDVQPKDFTLEFIGVDYSDFDIIKHFFYAPSDLNMLSKQEVIDKINNFPFKTGVDFDWVSYIITKNENIANVKDILTCAICYTYFGILKIPKMLNTGQGNNITEPQLFIKIKSPQKYDTIAKYLTKLDIALLEDVIKSRKTKLSEAIMRMTEDKERYFSPNGIARHGPKMAAIFDNIINGNGALKLNNVKSTMFDVDVVDDADYYGDDDVIGDDVDVDDDDDGDDDGIIKKGSMIVDESIYIIPQSSILFPSDELLPLEFNETYQKLLLIDNKRFIDALLATDNNYIIYSTKTHRYFEKLFIKGANIYGQALMKYRNYLKGNVNDDYEHYAMKTSIISHSNIYDSNNVTGGPALVYSEFNNAEGIAIFSKVLEYAGFEQAYGHEEGVEITPNLFAPRYAIISGNVGMAERQEIVEYFNHPLNAHGQFIQILLCTSAAAEGINLKYIRQVHILEPFWHNIKIQQVIGRARRLYSHASLPIDERNVYIYKYVAKGNSIESTDEYLHGIARKKDAIISEISSVMKEVSIDCIHNSKVDDVGQCFSYASNSPASSPAFSLIEKTKEQEKKVISSSVAFASVPGLGSYKTTLDGKPLEYNSLYKINIAPGHKFYDKYAKFANKELLLFPIYDTDKVTRYNEFIIVAYGHLLPSNRIIPFIKSILTIKK